MWNTAPSTTLQCENTYYTLFLDRTGVGRGERKGKGGPHHATGVSEGTRHRELSRQTRRGVLWGRGACLGSGVRGLAQTQAGLQLANIPGQATDLSEPVPPNTFQR